MSCTENELVLETTNEARAEEGLPPISFEEMINIYQQHD